MPVPKVSVVVVSYNTRDKLRRCLRSIDSWRETIVVDNDSSDGSADMVETEFPSVKLVRSSTNLGFGKANNVGFDRATGDLVLLLNSDCYPAKGAIDRLTIAMKEGVVAAGGKLLNPDGSLQESIAGPLTLWAVLLEQTYLDTVVRKIAPRLAYWRTKEALARANPTAEVDQVMGACLLMRRVERFDERYFLYCEDTDLCLRLRRHGKIVYVPEAEFTHELGSSSAGTARWKSVARYNRGKELFFRIHHGAPSSIACFALNRFGALLRLIVWSILGPFLGRRDQPALFWKVFTGPLQGPTNS